MTLNELKATLDSFSPVKIEFVARVIAGKYSIMPQRKGLSDKLRHFNGNCSTAGLFSAGRQGQHTVGPRRPLRR